MQYPSEIGFSEMTIFIFQRGIQGSQRSNNFPKVTQLLLYVRDRTVFRQYDSVSITKWFMIFFLNLFFSFICINKMKLEILEEATELCVSELQSQIFSVEILLSLFPCCVTVGYFLILSLPVCFFYVVNDLKMYKPWSKFWQAISVKDMLLLLLLLWFKMKVNGIDLLK